MSLISKRGDEAKEAAQKQKIDFKKVFIKLKNGDSIRVRIPSATEYVQYMAHGAFDLNIYTQPCTKPIGQRCAFDEVAEYVSAADIGKDDEDHPLYPFRGLYAKERYMFALYDIDLKMIRLFDGTKDQAQGLIKTIEQYAKVDPDDGEDAVPPIQELAFTFSRTGDKNATKYELSPILKLKPADKEKFDSFDGVVPPSLYEDALFPRSFEEQVDQLRKAGFPAIDELFGDVKAAADDDAKPVDADPTRGF